MKVRDKIIYLDVETTGLNPGMDSIHQLAGIVVIDGEEKTRFNFRMRPKGVEDFPDDYVTPVGGITKEELLTYREYGHVFNGDFLPILDRYVDRYSRLDKFHMAGYNCQNFDQNFIRHLFSRCGNNFYRAYFYTDTLDVMILAANATRRVRHKLPDFKLATVAGFYGFDPGDTQYHDALTDIIATKFIHEMIAFS